MVRTLKQAFTFDDVLLAPGYTDFTRADVSCSTQLTKHITLAIPFVASPMDTVTEGALALALARLGGIGFVHRNLTIDEQVHEVVLVKNEGLQVGAAVGVATGYEDRAKRLVEAGVDVLLIDSAHGYSGPTIKALKYLKKQYKVDIVAGNVATAKGAQALIEAGADALRVGLGAGAICSTRVISGVGVPQLTAIMDVAGIAQQHRIPVIADGGIHFSGDVVKALAAGASTVMMGRIFGAAEESPGRLVELAKNEVPARFKDILTDAKSYKFKAYRGMGSQAAIAQGRAKKSEDEYHGNLYEEGGALTSEGVESLIPCSGKLQDTVEQLLGGMQTGFYYAGAKNIPQLWQDGELMQIGQASLTESHPHDLFITNGGGNYS